MGIKERFYANLEMLREDYDPVKKKEAEDDEWSSKKLKPSTSGAAKFLKKSSEKNKKKAVTGMDEEAEQLEESPDNEKIDYKERFYQNLQEAREPWKKEGSWSKMMKRQQKKVEKQLTPKAKAARDAAAERKIDEEQLDEVSKELAKRAEHKAAKKFYDKYDSTTDLRKKAIKSKDKKDIEAAKKEEDKMHKAGRQAAKFQKYAAKKKLKEAEQLEESPDNEKIDYKAPGVKKLKNGTYWAKSQSGSMRIFKSEKAAIQHSKNNIDEEQLDEGPYATTKLGRVKRKVGRVLGFGKKEARGRADDMSISSQMDQLGSKEPVHGKELQDQMKKSAGSAGRAAKRYLRISQGKKPFGVNEEQFDEVNKKSIIGKFLRGRKAIAKGYGTFGKAITADTNDQAKKHIRNANRYYNLTTGAATTPKGFPKSTVKEAEQLDEISAGKAEKAYQKTMKRMEWHDSVAGVMRHGGYKDSEKSALERSAKLRKKAVKFANYADKKK